MSYYKIQTIFFIDSVRRGFLTGLNNFRPKFVDNRRLIAFSEILVLLSAFMACNCSAELMENLLVSQKSFCGILNFDFKLCIFKQVFVVFLYCIYHFKKGFLRYLMVIILIVLTLKLAHFKHEGYAVLSKKMLILHLLGIWYYLGIYW